MNLVRAGDDSPLFVFAHGAGAGSAHPWMRRVAAALAERGLSTVTFDFPYIERGRRVPDRNPVLEEAYRAAWTQARELAARERLRPPAMFAGGKSMGGRIASQTAAAGALDPPPGGLVFFGYPLHPPGKPDNRRDRHLRAITAPMLFLHGARDPFGSPAELEDLVRRLQQATNHVVAHGDHSLVAPKTRQADPAASFDRALDVAAAWMQDAARANGWRR